MSCVPDLAGVTLGILAGGAARRLGGLDKAWLQRDGTPLVVALATALAAQVDTILVSSNRDPARLAGVGLAAVADRHPGHGPLAGLDALLAACRGPWLLSVPVDLLHLPAGLAGRLNSPGGRGGWARDGDGIQPLVALWPVAASRAAVAAALAEDRLAIHAVQARLAMPAVDFGCHRFGNLNTPADLAAAGIVAR